MQSKYLWIVVLGVMVLSGCKERDRQRAHERQMAAAQVEAERVQAQGLIDAAEAEGRWQRMLLEQTYARKAEIAETEAAHRERLRQWQFANAVRLKKEETQRAIEVAAVEAESRAIWMSKFAEAWQQHAPAFVAGVAIICLGIFGIKAANGNVHRWIEKGENLQAQAMRQEHSQKELSMKLQGFQLAIDKMPEEARPALLEKWIESTAPALTYQPEVKA